MHCEAAASCESLAGKLSNLTITFEGADEHTFYDVTIDPTMYLLNTDDDAHCESLLSESVS